MTGARHALRCACLACAERRAAVRLATQDRRRWPRPALDWRGVPFPDSVAAGRAGLAARAPRLASLLLVPLPHVARDGVQRADLLGPLDLAELDRLPDGPARDAEFGSSFLDEHVVTLHTGDVTEISRLVIDYTTGQFSG